MVKDIRHEAVSWWLNCGGKSCSESGEGHREMSRFESGFMMLRHRISFREPVAVLAHAEGVEGHENIILEDVITHFHARSCITDRGLANDDFLQKGMARNGCEEVHTCFSGRFGYCQLLSICILCYHEH
jgi:hypothetical protein